MHNWPLVPAMTVLLLVPAVAQGQRPTGTAPQWEVRADATVSPDLAAHGGVGINVRAGQYMRLGAAYLAGAARGPVGDRDARFSQRIDASARFLLDPFAERPRGLYGGAGFTARQDAGEALRGDLMLVIGIEGAARGRATPSIELTLGGGVRVGVVLRQTRIRRFGR
jgi:hypothetical protein